jgi:hypothetical protein
MANATLIQVKEFFGTPDHPVTTREIRDLTPADREELCTLVGIELGL